MSVKCSRSHLALIILLLSRHVMMDDVCIKLGEDLEIGKKVPVSPFKVLNDIGLLMCFRECEAYAICLSINFNRNVLMCELNSQKRNANLSLVNDNDFIYREIPCVLDYRDKRCGSLQCNQYSKCVRTTSNQQICIAIEEPRSCMDILRRYPDRRGKDGVYSIIAGVEKKYVFCDMSTDQGGWTVIQRRQNSSINFYRPWNEYRAGFGDPSSNYWIGSDAINALTMHKDQELRVDLEDFEGEKAYALYSTFYVEDVNSNYRLNVSGFSGTAGDSLAYHNGMDFSTYDDDNDSRSNENCAVHWKGAWWYNGCHHSNLNGGYATAALAGAQYISWRSWKDQHIALKGALMMIRTKL